MKIDKETKGAWIIHHARKIATDTSAPSEYSVLDEAGKAAELLMRLGETQETTLNSAEVNAIARASKLNPRTELPHYLELLKEKRLIDTAGDDIQVLGITTRGVLSHATDIFESSQPSTYENAAIALGEISSNAPILLREAEEYIGDSFKIKSAETKDFLRRSAEIGFVDQEGDDYSSTLLFNGNLFKKDTVAKANKVLSSLSSSEQTLLIEITEELNRVGCIYAENCERVLSQPLFEKLKAAGVLEVNTVSNEHGDHSFVTLPGAFHKYVNPLIDDTFDMAKALVSALAYGMKHRPASQGRILSVDWILSALIQGRTIGPATAIGSDYRILEQNRVIKLIPATNQTYRMKLLKREVGELALQVLKRGNANAEAIHTPPNAPMSHFSGPEYTREQTRKRQSQPSKRHTHDILDALRAQRGI